MFLRKFLEIRVNKQISSDTLAELVEVVLKNNIFEVDEKTFKQNYGTAIRPKFSPPYAILFMADFDERMLGSFERKPVIWWEYIDDIFFIWEHGKESLKVCKEQVNMFHPTLKFTAEYSKEEVIFSDVNKKLTDAELKADLFVKATDMHRFLDPRSKSGKQLDNHQDSNTASLSKTRLEGKFVSKNVIKLSRRNLSWSEIPLLSKGLKSVPSANEIDQAKL